VLDLPTRSLRSAKYLQVLPWTSRIDPWESVVTHFIQFMDRVLLVFDIPDAILLLLFEIPED